jgi:hypothetical protein
MYVGRVVVFFLALGCGLCAVVTSPDAAGAQTLNALVMQCDTRYTFHRWSEVIDVCSQAASGLSDAAANRDGLSEADLLGLYENLVGLDARIAVAYLQLGNLAKGRYYVQQGRRNLGAAEVYGLSRSSAKYQELKAFLDQTSRQLAP